MERGQVLAQVPAFPKAVNRAAAPDLEESAPAAVAGLEVVAALEVVAGDPAAAEEAAVAEVGVRQEGVAEGRQAARQFPISHIQD